MDIIKNKEDKIKKFMEDNQEMFLLIKDTKSINLIHDLLFDNILYNPSNGIEALYLAIYYVRFKNDVIMAKKYLNISVEMGNYDAYNCLGMLHHQDIEKKIYYYICGVEKGSTLCMISLAHHYGTIMKDNDIMTPSHLNERSMIEARSLCKKYYLMAIEKGDSLAMNNLGHYYQTIEKNRDMATKYYMMAIEYGCTYAMRNLAAFNSHNTDLAVKYYLMAIENNDMDAYSELGYYYYTHNDYISMQKYYILGIVRENARCMSYFGDYFFFYKNEYDSAIKYYTMASDKNYFPASYMLGEYYENKNINYELMLKYYLIAVKNGSRSAADKLVEYFLNQKNQKMFEKNGIFYEFINLEHIQYMLPYVFKVIKKLYDDRIRLIKSHFEYAPDGSNNDGYIKSKNEFTSLLSYT